MKKNGSDMHFTALFCAIVVTIGIFYAMAASQRRTHVVIQTKEQMIVGYGLILCFVWAFYLAFRSFL